MNLSFQNMINSEQDPSICSGQATATIFLNRIVAVQVSNLRDDAANWKQPKPNRIV